MTVKVLRADGGTAAGIVRALDAKGSPIGEARFTLRRRIARRRRLSTCRSSCATTLPGWRFPASAPPARCNCLTSAGAAAPSASSRVRPATPRSRCWRRPSISTRALAPFADVRLGDRGAPQQAITQFLDQKLPMIVMADVGTLSPEIRERLNAWIDQGGVLVRFAGPRLAQADDDLVPVKLRRGGRTLGGSLTWEKPQHLAAFPPTARSQASPCRRMSPSAGRCSPSPMRCWRPRAGRRWKTARRWSPASVAARAWSACSMSAPTCAGPICRCRAPSSRCCGGSSTCPAIPRSPAQASRAKPTDGDGGAAAHARRLRRVRPAALDRKAAAGRLPRPRHVGSSAGLLRPGRRPARGQHARCRRPHRAARHGGTARASRELHQCRTARSARHAAVGLARAVPDRRDRRRPARRAASPRCCGGARRRRRWRSRSSGRSRPPCRTRLARRAPATTSP